MHCMRCVRFPPTYHSALDPSTLLLSFKWSDCNELNLLFPKWHQIRLEAVAASKTKIDWETIPKHLDILHRQIRRMAKNQLSTMASPASARSESDVSFEKQLAPQSRASFMHSDLPLPLTFYKSKMRFASHAQTLVASSCTVL